MTAPGFGAIRVARQPAANIVGISAGYHDSACCLLRDGVLVAAAEEERFSGVKHDKSLPRRAFRYCLEQGGLTIDQIDCVAFYEDSALKRGRQVWMALHGGASAVNEAVVGRLIAPDPETMIADVLGYQGRVEVCSHHHSHAASSYYFSGFARAAILTVDGVGEWATTSYGYGEGARIEQFEEVDFPDSLGLFYAALTSYLGFEVNEGEYKVMGLASYGAPLYVDRLRPLVASAEGGQYRLDMKFFDFMDDELMYTRQLESLLGRPAREPESAIEPFHCDVAKSVQIVLEDVLLDKVRYLFSQRPTENLCMAGGVAHNVVANARCLREGPFRRLFVPPAAGDSGASLGAAAAAHVRLTGCAPVRERLRHAYLGPAAAAVDIGAILGASSAPFESFVGRERALLDRVAGALADGQVVGWFQGRMEFGPRALGARSILADPRRPEMRDRINSVVKMREHFRPFAPAVLQAKAADHFDLDHPSPFMLETCQVRSPLSLPATTHVDNSARVQTVDGDTHPRFAALLEAFERRTGCPILLNTSFNLRSDPIVCTPIDAIACFVKSQIDLLVLEDYVVTRAAIPPLWEAWATRPQNWRGYGETIGHRVYTLL